MSEKERMSNNEVEQQDKSIIYSADMTEGAPDADSLFGDTSVNRETASNEMGENERVEEEMQCGQAQGVSGGEEIMAQEEATQPQAERHGEEENDSSEAKGNKEPEASEERSTRDEKISLHKNDEESGAVNTDEPAQQNTVVQDEPKNDTASMGEPRSVTNDKPSRQDPGDREFLTYGKAIKMFLILTLTALLTVGIWTLATTLGGDRASVNKIKKAVQHMYDENAYIQLMVGQEQYVYLLYNKDGEALAESNVGGVAFYRNSNEIVSINDIETIIDYDMNPLQFIKQVGDTVLSIGDAGTITAESKSSDVELNNDEEGNTTIKDKVTYTLYTLTIDGKDNIRKIYSAVDEEYAEESMKLMYTGFEDVEDTQLVLKVSVGDNGEFGASCEVSFNNDVYTSWLFDGYISTFDWELGDAWYAEGNDQDTWIELASTKLDELSTKMVEFMQAHNIQSDVATTSTITYNDWAAMNDADRQITMEAVLDDIRASGGEVNCTAEDLMVALDAYYSVPDNQGFGVLQSTINVGMENNWIVQRVEDAASYTGEGENINTDAGAANMPSETNPNNASSVEDAATTE